MYDYEDDNKYLYLLISFVIAMVIFFSVIFAFILTYEPPKPKENKTRFILQEQQYNS